MGGGGKLQMLSRLGVFSVSYLWAPGREAPGTSLKDSHLKAPGTEASETNSINCPCVSRLVSRDLYLGQAWPEGASWVLGLMLCSRRNNFEIKRRHFYFAPGPTNYIVSLNPAGRMHPAVMSSNTDKKTRKCPPAPDFEAGTP